MAHSSSSSSHDVVQSGLSGIFPGSSSVTGLDIFKNMLGSLDSITVDDSTMPHILLVTNSFGMQALAPSVVVTEANVVAKLKIMRTRSALHAAFANEVELDPEDVVLMRNEAAIRALHLGLVQMAFGIVTNADVNKLNQDEPFYRVSKDLERLGIGLTHPIHTDSEVMGNSTKQKTASGSYIDAYQKFKNGYVVSVGEAIGVVLQGKVLSSLDSMIIEPPPKKKAPKVKTSIDTPEPNIVIPETENTYMGNIESRKLHIILRHFNINETDPVIALQELSQKGLDEEVDRVMSNFSTIDDRINFAQNCIKAYFEEVHELVDHKLTEIIEKVLTDPDGSIIDMIKIANTLISSNSEPGKKPNLTLELSLNYLPRAFHILRDIIVRDENLMIEEVYPYMKQFGELVEKVLANSWKTSS